MPKSSLPQEPTFSAAYAHVLETQGRGFRGDLVRAVSGACGLKEECAMLAATAVEHFHLASLVVDDLPAMDDAKERRGHACVHTLFGESSALLAALGLIHGAYMKLWRFSFELDKDAQKKVFELVDDCLGLTGILNGQAWDLHMDATMKEASFVEAVARLKTGELLRLSLLLPAYAVNASTEVVNALESLALQWSLVYQGTDDLYDMLMSEECSDKDVGKDVLKGRPNLAIMLGKVVAIERVKNALNASEQAVNRLKLLDGHWAGLDPFEDRLKEKVQTYAHPISAA